ncbi:MAG: ATP:cob(I)alamin adenosyltransferase [Clostridia bacterium]|nr:ATP:cob(I)alamin adenosyltransferase [Clostridia bacterium]
MIYTKCGDGGYSSVISCHNIPKDNSIFALLGDIDELGAALGICKTKQCESIANKLNGLQHELICLSSWIAGGKVFDAKSHTADFEVVIDTLENAVGLPDRIVVSGSTEESAYINFCRTVARRCERSAVTFCSEYSFDNSLIVYLNRLADYLFVLGVYSEQI